MQLIKKDSMEKSCKIEKNLPLIFVILITSLTLFISWEPGQESIGYWYFSKILASHGEFVIPARGPIYTVYLLPFGFLPYPHSENFEYIISSIFVLYAFYILLTKLSNKYIAIFSIFLWAPFIQTAEPTPQKLALGIYFIAVLLRLNINNKNRNLWFYGLILLATLIRDIYFGIIIIYIVYDLISMIIKCNKPINKLIGFFRVKRLYIVFIPILILFAVIHYNQSKDNFNNVEFATTKWFPGDPSKMGSTALLQAFNWRYIELKYGTFVGHDFYQTNHEAFGGANSLIELANNNPILFTRIVFENIRWFSIHFFSQLSFINNIPFKLIILPIILLLIFYGAFKYSNINNEYKLLIFSCACLALISILNIPKPRYMLSLIPIYVMGISYFSLFTVKRLGINFLTHNLVFILIFSIFSWGNILKWISINPNHIALENILSFDKNSLKRSSFKINELGVDCEGVMALEHLHLKTNLPAFQNINVYDVWEIPPFGNYGDHYYSGLNTNRINCLFISNNFATGVGAGTNYKLRYDNYVLPYERHLMGIGAVKTEIDGYGYSIVLKRN